MASQRVMKLFAIVYALAGITRNRSKEFFTITVRERFSVAMCFTFVTFVLGLSFSLRSRSKDQFLRNTLPALSPVSEKITWDTFEIFLNEENKLVQDSDWEAFSREAPSLDFFGKPPPITPGTLTPYLERLDLYNDGLVLQLKEPWDKLKNQSYIGFYLKNQNKLESKKAETQLRCVKENGGKLQMLQVHTNGARQKWVLDEVPTKLGSPFQREDSVQENSDKPPVATPINWQDYSSLLATSSNKPTNTIETFKNLFTTHHIGSTGEVSQPGEVSQLGEVSQPLTEKTLIIATNLTGKQGTNKEYVGNTSQDESKGVRWQDIFLPRTEAIAASDVEDTTAGLFQKTRSRLMSGYIYPDLKKDEQLLVKGTKEVVLPPSIRFPLLHNLGFSGENCKLPIGKIKYKGVVYSGINELRNILSVLKIDVSDKELGKVDLWELAYGGPAVPLDKKTKDIIPKNKKEISHRIATLLRESDDRIPFLDRKGNFLGKKEFFWGEGVTVEGLQLALQTRPYNELEELDPPFDFLSIKSNEERNQGCIKSKKPFFKNVFAGSEPKSIFLEFIDPIDEEEDDVAVDPIEMIITKSPSMFKEKDEVVWLESKEWSNILKSIITHGLSDGGDLKNIEILVPSIMVATVPKEGGDSFTGASLPYDTLVSEPFYTTLYKKQVTSFSSRLAPSSNGGDLRPLFHNIWEPITPTSWMILYKLGFAMWVQEIGKDFYKKYGKETILYVLDLLASLGFNPQDIIEELGLDDTFIRVIRKVDRRFADVAGVNHILPELGEIVWFLRSSGRGGQTSKGILLVGPPGTGKTFVVQAIAGEAKVPVIVQSASALTDPNQRQSGPQKLRDLFDEARQLSPCILFIDEIDTLGVSRPHVIGDTMGKNELLESIENPGEHVREIPPQLHYYEQFLESPKNSFYKDDENNDQEEDQLTVYQGQDNPGLDPFVIEIIESHNEEHRSKLERLALLMQFLMEIDGLRNLHGVVVIGATNRSSLLDQAFTRPGRFEKTLFLQLPDKEKRIEILKLYTKITPVCDATKFGVLDYIAKRTAGLSAAHLAAAVNQSSIKGIVDKTGHTIKTIEHGVNRILNRSLRQSQPTLRALQGNVSNVRNLGDRLDIELQHLTSFPPSLHTLLTLPSNVCTVSNVRNVTPTSLGLQEFTSHLLETLQDKAVSRLLMKKALLVKNTSSPYHITKSCQVKDTSLLNQVKDSKKMSRFAFYQAGKAILQTELPLHPSVSFLPLEPEVFHRSTSDLSKLLLSSQPQRRVVLETRLIGVYAGKAGELLGLSQLTLQSDLGAEELSFAGLIANHMITTWYLYSKKISLQKLILSSISQDEMEIEIEDPILLDLLRHLETKIEDETRLAGRASYRYQQRFAPSWWQKQTMTEELLVEPKDSNWYRLHIPDPKETVRNIDWIGPDEHYHSIDANIFKNTETTRNNGRSKTPKPGRPQIRWNDLYLINRDYIYQGLISNCFHKAINLLDKKRELLDFFADQLIRYNLLRQHEIGVIWKQFNIVKASDIPRKRSSLLFRASIPPCGRKGWGSYSRRKTPKFIDFDFVKPCFYSDYRKQRLKRPR